VTRMACVDPVDLRGARHILRLFADEVMARI
jgi:hypothetical protein